METVICREPREISGAIQVTLILRRPAVHLSNQRRSSRAEHGA